MSALSPTDHRGIPSRRPRLTLSRPMFPEGLISPVLMIALVTLAGYCVESSDWARLVIPVAWVAFLSSLFGSIVAKLRVLDSFAHMLSILAGAGLSFGLVAMNADGLDGSLVNRVREIGAIGVHWYLGDPVGDDMEALLVSLLMGIILWLVGYLAAWSLFRRGWLFSALFLPGFLILVNLGYSEDPNLWFLTAFAFLALVLTARHTFYLRQREWNRRRLGRPKGVGETFFATGVIVALIATTIGWRVPSSISQSALQPLAGEISDRALSIQDRASEWMQNLSGDPSGSPMTSGSYTSFGESFSVGGPLELTNDPAVLVFADQAPYLTAQHYDSYSGRGWYSTTEDTFNPEGPDGRRYSPEMTFAPDQQVPLSDDVLTDRESSAIEIRPLSPMGDRVLTVDTYQSASIRSSVRMSWMQLDNVVYDVGNSDVASLPRDIQRIAFLLQSGDLSGELGEGGPTASDADLQSQIDEERSQLAARFLTVTWNADESGNLQSVTLNGQLPVYDDVEAVFSQDSAVQGGSYRVLASSSTATAEQLASAGEVYPTWVTDRYLSLPNTITPRTVDVTLVQTAQFNNPYEKARAIEQYLRQTIVYDETVEAPPDDADIVDYLLFERQRGYCEYSATAMTVMLRAIGIPARVSVGFYPGDYDSEDGGYLYTQKNAHAWTEVYFPGYGWIPFEPTSSRPLIEEGEVPGNTDEPTPLPTALADVETPEALTPTTESSPASDLPDDASSAPQVSPETDSGGAGIPLALGVVLLTAGVVALAGWLMWILPLRGLAPSAALFSRIRRIGRWMGVPASPSSTPSEYGQAFAERVPQAKEHVDRIVKTYEIDQFGPARADDGFVRSAQDAWDSLRKQVPRMLTHWRR